MFEVASKLLKSYYSVFPQTEASIANSEGFLETKVGSPGSQFLYEKDAPLTGDDQVTNFVV